MKKTGRFVLFAVFFLLGLFVSSNSVEAASRANIFDADLIGKFELYQMGSATFNRRDDDYNYTFTYDYMIYDVVAGDEKYIYDGASPVSYYYGFSYVAGKKHEISYENIPDPLWGFGTGAVSDEFVIYKYNSVSKEFVELSSSGVNPKDPGTVEISDPGIYKVDTLVDGIGGKSAYLIYEPSSIELSLVEDPFTIVDSGSNLAITVNLITRDLKDMNECYTSVGVKVGETVYVPTCEITKNEELNVGIFQGYYNLKLTWVTTNRVRNAPVIIAYNGREVTSTINYDLKNPEITSFVYRNANISLDGLEIVAEENNVLPHDSVAVITISDDSAIAEVSMKYVVNDVKQTSACSYDVTNKVAYCYIVATKVPPAVTFYIEDEYGNSHSVSHLYTYDTRLLIGDETLEEHITRNENVFTASFEGDNYSDVNKICIFYGESLSAGYECGEYPTVTAHYYYKGTINVVVFDAAFNFATYQIDEVEFLNGYLEENFTYTPDIGDAPKFNNKLNVTSYVESLKNIACGEDSECKDNVLVEVKYGDLVEELPEDMILPTYGEILNKKYKDSLCATQLCDKTVELIVNYAIGDNVQKISAYINYTDEMPYINTKFTYDDFIELEYKKFDIKTDTKLIQDLFGDEMNINLVDKNGINYSGKISPVLVEYTDRNGATTKLDNLAYNKISEMNGFGVYLLECRIQVLKDVTNDTIYQDTIYSKSFFIRIELSDKEKPVITLIGKDEIEVKQYGAYKEPGYRCVDDSTCKVTVKYYLNDDSNEVSGVDTDVVGKYIVKYVAVDGDGNQSDIVTRTINVVSVNSFDNKSIIIIISIVVVLAVVVTTIIVLEVRKNKRMKEKEDF